MYPEIHTDKSPNTSHEYLLPWLSHHSISYPYMFGGSRFPTQIEAIEVSRSLRCTGPDNSASSPSTHLLWRFGVRDDLGKGCWKACRRILSRNDENFNIMVGRDARASTESSRRNRLEADVRRGRQNSGHLERCRYHFYEPLIYWNWCEKPPVSNLTLTTNSIALNLRPGH